MIFNLFSSKYTLIKYAGKSFEFENKLQNKI